MLRAAITTVLLLTASVDAVASEQVGGTSLTDKTVSFTVPTQHHVVLRRDDIQAIIVDNAAVDIPHLPEHRSGYNGVASLTHSRQPNNLFVPGIAGLNFEHIHDGTKAGLIEKFEPRKYPMQLRVIDEHTVELYQPATKNWQLESCGRYQLLPDGIIEYTFECVPRTVDYKYDYIGLFWASYIHQPQDKAIFFKGRPAGSKSKADWIKAITPSHGIDSTHAPSGTATLPPVDADFPLTLVNHPSKFEAAESWYYGVSHNMAFVQMYRPEDNIWIAQSPSGGGNGNPAWDFQWFIPQPVVGKTYRFVMRAAYLPFQNPEQIESFVDQHGF